MRLKCILIWIPCPALTDLFIFITYICVYFCIYSTPTISFSNYVSLLLENYLLISLLPPPLPIHIMIDKIIYCIPYLTPLHSLKGTFLLSRLHDPLVCMYVCMYVGMNMCMYICMYVCMYVCMHVIMYICIYVLDMHACTYACVGVYLWV